MHGQHGFVGFVGCRPVAAPSAGQWRRRLHTRRLLTPPADVTAMHCSDLEPRNHPPACQTFWRRFEANTPGNTPQPHTQAAARGCGSCVRAD